jgi:nicotinate-nucleotide adenylyltransferase
MKTGILGGTFNPIHLAHLRIAEEVRLACGLDRVLFMPAATPPHKPLADDIPFAHRYAMVEAAVADNPYFSGCDLEAQRPGKSYSVATLEILHDQFPEDEFYFIIGMDSWWLPVRATLEAIRWRCCPLSYGGSSVTMNSRMFCDTTVVTG